MQADAQGFVLAGGRSRRMGAEKALLPFGGRPLIEHALAVLAGAGLRAAIAGARPGLSQYAPVVADEQEGRGPLAGICAALRWSHASWNFFTTVDMPLLPPLLAVRMLDAAAEEDGAVLLTLGDGFVQTFPAVVRRELLPLLDEQLAGGHAGARHGIEEAARRAGLQVKVLALEECARGIAEADQDGMAPKEWMLNLNTPEEVKRAEETLRKKKRH